MPLLAAIGFREEGESMVLPPGVDAVALGDARRALALALASAPAPAAAAGRHEPIRPHKALPRRRSDFSS